MSMFQCDHCGCAENTATGVSLFVFAPNHFDWSYAPERKGLKLCSACGPSKHKDGSPTLNAGKWHGLFARVYLPKGKFVTNSVGNLEHCDTGSDNYIPYILEAPDE